jgi:hypothetical protein
MKCLHRDHACPQKVQNDLKLKSANDISSILTKWPEQGTKSGTIPAKPGRMVSLAHDDM